MEKKVGWELSLAGGAPGLGTRSRSAVERSVGQRREAPACWDPGLWGVLPAGGCWHLKEGAMTQVWGRWGKTSKMEPNTPARVKPHCWGNADRDRDRKQTGRSGSSQCPSSFPEGQSLQKWAGKCGFWGPAAAAPADLEGRLEATRTSCGWSSSD